MLLSISRKSYHLNSELSPDCDQGRTKHFQQRKQFERFILPYIVIKQSHTSAQISLELPETLLPQLLGGRILSVRHLKVNKRCNSLKQEKLKTGRGWGGVGNGTLTQSTGSNADRQDTCQTCDDEKLQMGCADPAQSSTADLSKDRGLRRSFPIF